MNPTLPTLFISHGAPTMALQDRPSTRAWRLLGQQLPAPAAILVVSAHHHAREPTLTGSAMPGTIHDFGGFPETLYQLEYPAPGSPELAEQVQGKLRAAGFSNARIDPDRGIDHGVWVPLRHLYPSADIPVVSLSVNSAEDARWHYQLGQSVANLRNEGVLVIGSGGLTHNLGALDWHHHGEQPAAWAQAFVDWFVGRLRAHDLDALLEWRIAAPEPLRNHPTPEHLLPVFVAMGAARSLFDSEIIAPAYDLGSLALHGIRFH